MPKEQPDMQDYENIMRLENALYEILDCGNISQAKEIAAEAVNEDLEAYLEEDNLEELDFENDDNIPWEDIPEENE